MDVQPEYHLIRSTRRKRTVCLHIKEDGRVVIYAPDRMPKWSIDQFIEEKRLWIDRKLSEKEQILRERVKRFLPGERFLYLGVSYPLEITENGEGHPLKLAFGKFILDKDHREEARNLFVQWYKREAAEKITERVRYYSEKVELIPAGVRITSARRSWGSCSPNNRLSFSWRMILASFKIIDYVLLHELVHIKEKNHSKRFWNDLESILPDYRTRRQWLKENGHSLQF